MALRLASPSHPLGYNLEESQAGTNIEARVNEPGLFALSESQELSFTRCAKNEAAKPVRTSPTRPLAANM